MKLTKIIKEELKLVVENDLYFDVPVADALGLDYYNDGREAELSPYEIETAMVDAGVFDEEHKLKLYNSQGRPKYPINDKLHLVGVGYGWWEIR